MILDTTDDKSEDTGGIDNGSNVIDKKGKKESGKGGSKKEAAGVSLVGHVTPIEVASFSPFAYRHGKDRREFQDQSNESVIDSNYLVAVGSQDGSISLWSNTKDRPVAVLDGIFEHTVLDIAWTADGMGIVAVSYDGHAVLIKLSADLVGESMQTYQYH